MNIKQVISVVEKWIADPESVGQEELRAAYDVANAAVDAADAWYADAWYAAAVAAAASAACALHGDVDGTKYWVAEYHKLIKDNA